MAPGPQRLYPSGPGLYRRYHQQSARGRAHLSSARRQLSFERGRPLPSQHGLRQRDRGRQAAPSAVPSDRRGGTPLRQGNRALAMGEQRRGSRARRRAGLRRRRRHAEALAAAAILREHLPELRLRFINVVDLFKLTPASEHPHGLSDRDFDGLFTVDKPIVFNFHGYPYLIHKLTYRRTNHRNLHVRGYKEIGSINTPLQLAIANQIDRFNLANDIIDRVPWARNSCARLKDWLKDQIVDHLEYALEHGVDKPETANWRWPF